MLTLITPPSTEPVTVAEAALAARVDGPELNSLIASAITAAREQAQQITGRLYGVQEQRASLADWPAITDGIAVHAATAVAISYWNGAAWANLPSTEFVFAPGGCADVRTALAPALGKTWPVLGAVALGPRVRVDLTAGVPPEQTPESVKLYIKAQVAAWVKNPEALASGNLARNPLFDSLLDAERLWV